MGADLKIELLRSFLLHGWEGGSHPDGFIQYDVSCQLSPVFNDVAVDVITQTLCTALEGFGLSHAQTTKDQGIFSVTDLTAWLRNMDDSTKDAAEIMVTDYEDKRGTDGLPISYQFRFNPDDLGPLLQSIQTQQNIGTNDLGIITKWRALIDQSEATGKYIRTEHAPLLKTLGVTL